jgi:hypothetical protein
MKRTTDVALPMDQETHTAVNYDSIDSVSLLGSATIFLHF